MHYKHFTIDDRKKIEFCFAVGLKVDDFAAKLGFDRSSVYREKERNSLPNGKYDAEVAHAKAIARTKNGKQDPILLIQEELRTLIQIHLFRRWSPEQISHRLKLEGYQVPCTNTIYRAIQRGYLDTPDEKGTDYLRRRGKRYKYKKEADNEKRGKVKVENTIHDRPGIADEQVVFGFLEIDTVRCEKKKSPVLVTAVDKASRYCFVGLSPDKKSENVCRTLCMMLDDVKDHIYTITPDRGLEFANYKMVEKALDTTFYFADPYSSYQRGQNERMNGDLRDYFPRNCDLNLVTIDDIKDVVNELNNRPRKCLKWRTPAEIKNGLSAVALNPAI